MSRVIVVTGTDTGIGKTVFAAALTAFLGASYWKPVQAGLEGETDSGTVRRLGEIPAGRIVPEAYRLRAPASPHLAAALEGFVIDPARLAIPPLSGPLVIEGAGGVMVPLTPELTFIDMFARWQLPLVLCARTSLGTINHTLLSVEALRRRAIPLLGVAFIGDAAPEAESAIAAIGRVPVLGRLPWIVPLGREGLQRAFRRAFAGQAFAGRGRCLSDDAT
ncbi:dethiobiotin synthase [Ancylobacter dichloromethanicus]|uniref:ATP-dependent dethiobiotin synthetase BioD n=1 Tax=Ancylobacter dichloromethanicus TaxID=518825 RepID=A0A9W6J948_9HYPH|nr:dethiobiotin synthase [Ancylobacter dichloromethanicus]MBS7552824.1 dethiobiotin synthase [Ancylobacter dichloromethanicus]GLK73186.1 ATP-dependent dethiobiotin synthetase BioD [Ancylobacter dichloromethanicus]